MDNTVAYNKYRWVFNEFNNPDIPGDAWWCTNVDFQVADVYLFAKRFPAVCPAQDGYPATIANHMAYIPCGEGLAGTIARYCDMEGKWGEEVPNCHAAAPKSIKYDVQFLELTAKKAMQPLTPVIDGKEVKVSSFPSLPEGLTIDSSTGVISGTPLEEMERKGFTINAANQEGSVYTTIAITVNKAAFNWLLLVIIIVIVIVVVVVVVVVLTASKKKKGSKAMPKSSKSKSGSKKMDAQPKAVIKV